MRLALWKWGRFLRPVKGWRVRYLAFLGGRTTWNVPDRPDADPVAPWPIEWMPHRQYALDEVETKRGFAFESCVCVDSGMTAQPGDAVSCLRCGVPLHTSAAGMLHGFDPPKCRRCVPLVGLVKLLGR